MAKALKRIVVSSSNCGKGKRQRRSRSMMYCCEESRIAKDSQNPNDQRKARATFAMEDLGILTTRNLARTCVVSSH